MMRARFEPVLNPIDFGLDDIESERIPPPVQIPRASASRIHKPVRHIPPPAIGTRTLGRANNKQPDLLKPNKEYGITLSARAGVANVDDAFLIVLEVVDDSSSWNQGLRSRDLFVNFGGLTKEQFIASGSNLECLLPIVAKSLDTPLECIIIRGQRLFNIVLRGMRWDHGVCLGAVINTYPEPISTSQSCSAIPGPASLSTSGCSGQCKPALANVSEAQDITTAMEKYLHFDSVKPDLNRPYQCNS